MTPFLKFSWLACPYWPICFWTIQETMKNVEKRKKWNKSCKKIALCAFGITARPRDMRPQWLVCPTFGMFILSFFYRQFYLSPFYFDLYFHFKFLCELLAGIGAVVSMKQNKIEKVSAWNQGRNSFSYILEIGLMSSEFSQKDKEIIRKIKFKDSR